ncbi:hypothetical protein GDO86_001224 [Hymenochirus boettgeri]|uniref:Transmembrane protein 161A n=1 Tax=Hymenochirus boettgeri TaxID=247094 RepID=A0A8T2KK79_9PIPI|nr:hypothetical protein GDO86_001224 [Hymenochirus boettgeri]
MAVMGIQMVVTLLMASIMQRVSPHYSFARWLLCNGSLFRYKHPTEDELRTLAGKQKPKAKRERRTNGAVDEKPLTVPRDIDLHLDTEPITTIDALGLASICNNLEIFMAKQGWQWSIPFAKLAFKIALVALCSFLGACLTFPGLRLAQTHLDALKMAADRPMLQILLHTSFLPPVIVVVMWIRPITRDFLLNAPMGGKSVELMSNSAYNTFRLWIIVILCLLRFSLTRFHLQAYLGLADRWVDQMKREAGRISMLEIQRKISRIFCYLTVVALQYLAPIILTLHCVFMLKSQGGYSWGLYPEAPGFTPVIDSPTIQPPLPSSEEEDDSEDVQAAVEQIMIALTTLRGLFTHLFFQGLFSFLTWWVSVCQIVTSLFGLYFHQYLGTS